jgi:hypothetical protein
MKTIVIRSILAGSFLLSLITPLSAVVINIAPSDAILSGNQTGQTQIDAFIASTLNGATEAYKKDVDGGVETPLVNSYNTTFNPASEPSGATITYEGGPIVNPSAYLLVKDGNATPAWYLFNLTGLGWTGIETLELTGFWENTQGAISHVALYGGGGTGIRGVPDGGSTIALLGGALMLLGALARRGFTLSEV